MKNTTFKFKSSLTALVCGLAMIATEAHAGETKGKEGQAKAQADKNVQVVQKQGHEKMAKKSREVSGKVIAHKTVRLPKEKLQNMVVMLKTNRANDRLIVDLGNAKALTGLKIDKDTELQVEGRMARIGNHQILIARSVKHNGKMTKVDRRKQQEGAARAKKGA